MNLKDTWAFSTFYFLFSIVRDPDECYLVSHFVLWFLLFILAVLWFPVLLIVDIFSFVLSIRIRKRGDDRAT